MKTILIGINAKYIHTNLAIRLLKANCDYEVDFKEFTIKDNPKEIRDFIISNNYKLVGISAYIWNIEYIKNLLNTLKNYKDILVLLGGPEVSYNPKEYIKDFDVDFVIKGEGEIAFNQLVDALINDKPIENIPGLVTKEIDNECQEIENLKALKSPHYYPNDYENRVTYIESSRGCPFNCSYCMASLENKVRFFDLETVKKDLMFLMEKGTKVFKFLDRTFNVNIKNTYDLFNFIIENHYPNTSFQFEITGDILPKEVIEFLNKNAPKDLFRFEIGIQSTNDEANLLVNRRQNKELLFENIRLIQDANIIDLHLDLIAGLPKEDLESFKNTFDEVISLRPLELQLGILKFLKGTKLFKDAKKNKYKFSKTAPYEIISNDVLSSQDLDYIRIVEKVLDKYYNKHFMDSTTNYLLDNVNSPFDFFLNFGLYYQKKYSWFNHNLEDLFIRLLEYLLLIDFKKIRYIEFLMKYDYLNYFNIKPKIWWDRPAKKDRNKMIKSLHKSILKNYSLDDLYRYSLIEKYDNLYLIAIYKHNYKNVFIQQKRGCKEINYKQL